MRYDIVSDLPGRIRVRCRGLDIDPECRLELNRWIAEHPGLLSARLSPRTRGLLVHYSAELTRETVLGLLDGLRLFETVNVVERPAPMHAVVTDAAFKACRKQAASLVRNAVLPRPARWMFSGWKAGTGVCRLFDMLARGDMAGFVRGTVKFFLLALCGKSLPLRLLAFFVAQLVDGPRTVMVVDVDGDPGDGCKEVACESIPRALLPAPEESVVEAV